MEYVELGVTEDGAEEITGAQLELGEPTGV
jgi:hypothetical protein